MYRAGAFPMITSAFAAGCIHRAWFAAALLALVAAGAPGALFAQAEPKAAPELRTADDWCGCWENIKNHPELFQWVKPTYVDGKYVD